MALYFYTTDPAQLLANFKKKIVEKHIITWTIDKDGDFTHATEQWKNQAWLRPVIGSNHLALNILHPSGKNISSEVYAIYHGRFTESMLAHCDAFFSECKTTALPAVGDSVAA